MKKIYFFLLLLLCMATLFHGCSQNSVVTRQAKELGITDENYPKIDGSTSALPIIQEIYKAMFNPELINGEETWSGLPQEAMKTIESYKMLIDGELDLIIVPDPSEEVQLLIAEKGMELEYTPICLEALVFITLSDTWTNNITTEELKSIYTDMEINNWSQIGGQPRHIYALVRNEDSGSHALMEKFVLNGEKVNPQIESNNMMLTMIGMIENIEHYINTSYSGGSNLPLGYTIYYYLQNNKEEYEWENIKMLNIDGIEPNDETIASGEYPYSTNYYAIIKNDTPEDSPSRKLISWLLSEEGQEIISNSGFGIIQH